MKEGGENVIVISEAAREDQLFDPDLMKEYQLTLEPRFPPFPPEVVLDLVPYIGVCGMYILKRAAL